MSTRRDFLRSGAALAAPLGAAGAERPNIVLFYADDLDGDEVNCTSDPKLYPSYTGAKRLGIPGGRPYQDARMLTPHIDSLAREGAIFSRFYITSPVCTPARCSLLTGRYASRALARKAPPNAPAFIAWNTQIEPDETNLAKSLKALGYATGMVGKWHNFGRGAGVREVDPSLPEDADVRDPAIARAVRARYERALAYLREGFGWDFVDRVNIGNTEQTRPAAIRGQNLEWHTEGALDFLKQNHSRPFFLYYPLPVPHGQYHDLRKLNPLATIAGMLEKAPASQPSRESVYRRLKEAGIDERNAMGTWMDDAVGAVLKALDDYKVAGNTIVLFISDNPSRGKNSVYEGGRVPAIVRWPGRLKAGSRVNTLCGNIDVGATLIEAAGGTAPADMRMDGRSMLAQLRGGPEPADWRREILLEVHNSRAAVGRRWKYIANRVAPEVEESVRAHKAGWNGVDHHNYFAEADFPAYYDADQLYDLDADLYERRNLAASRKEALAEMKKRLAALLAPLPHPFWEFKK